MMTSLIRRLLVACSTFPYLIVSAEALAEQPSRTELAKRLPVAADRDVDFLKDVQPILRAHCFECHGGEVEEGGLNLAVQARALHGGDSGPVLRSGDSLASPLVHLVSGIDEERMMPPPDKQPLSTQQIGVLRAWIDQGAIWPVGADVLDPRITRAQEHWAFRRLRSIEPPMRDDDDDWSRNKIDLFIQQKLKAKQLTPSPPASGTTLVRRIYFDLVGLPPTPDEKTRFLAELEVDSQAASTQLIEQLLNSPRFGERWGRHWLDLARYADSDGQESDRDRPHAYRYRDFVIAAFNDDMPYDQFVRWQIAGDEYAPENDEAVAATGFLTAGPSMKLKDSFLERERLFNRYNELDDVVSTLGAGLLGLTVGCARCHDHKYDAFSAREYYQLLRVFHSGDRTSSKLPSGQEGFFFRDFDANVRTTWLFRRSDFYDREIEVDLAFPAILSTGRPAEAYWADARQAAPTSNSTLQRRALAEWITDEERGGGALMARVIVNRIWQHHFGRGLAPTSSDFGVRGEPPTHPELLEYLAHDLVSHGWKLKRLHRLILTSAVWQQANATPSEKERGASPTRATIDPQNRLLWHRVPRRLEVEALRDAMLAVSGTLNLQAGGPGFKPYIPPEANLARNIQGGDYPKDAPDDPATRRRSVYMFHKRLVPYPLFQAFDRPELMVSCARRQNTTVAPQAMALLNDRFVRSVAGDFATRLLSSKGDDYQDVVQEAFELSFSRPPTAAELDTSTTFIRRQASIRRARKDLQPHREAVTDFCHALFGLNEFIYID